MVPDLDLELDSLGKDLLEDFLDDFFGQPILRDLVVRHFSRPQCVCYVEFFKPDDHNIVSLISFLEAT